MLIHTKGGRTKAQDSMQGLDHYQFYDSDICDKLLPLRLHTVPPKITSSNTQPRVTSKNFLSYPGGDSPWKPLPNSSYPPTHLLIHAAHSMSERRYKFSLPLIQECTISSILAMSLQKGSSLVASANKIIGSSMGHSQLPHRISYPDGWRTGPTEAWYKSQPSTKFTQLQYRKERQKPWEHEYIVVELENGTVCRFDRRARAETLADAFTSEGLGAEDTAHVIDKHDKEHYSAIADNSDLVLCMHFPDGQDILSILGICHGIQQNRETECYSLIRYNCYFFSWMIVVALARRTVDWALLGSDDKLWDELVNTTMAGLNSDASKLDQLKANTRAMLGKKPNHAAPPFSGSSYLLNTLHIALHHTRSNIKESLNELLLKSTVEKTMHAIADMSAKSAAEDAARSHASQSARDASFEAVMDVMWKTMLSDPEGAQLWEDRCRRTEECVRKAAAAASDAALMQFPLTPPATPPSTPSNGSDSEMPLVRENWEDAWDSTWNQIWLNGQSQTKPKDGPATSRIALLAKAAWSKAWKDACLANEEYVPLVSQGVAKHVMKHLPETSIKIDKTAKGTMKRMMRSLVSSDASNSELQTFIQTRISDFVSRVLRLLPKADVSSQIIEESMRRVWVSTTRLEILPV
ncbi:unnamed protein product [Rhizoctonia solani]|uniref:Uncharacterized protein n=1 Tax=Rhizoctonia solani TaxID=456999 RepID=A0A8H3DFN5_9AGAM|nr:unnamed protein product [Rhizoctonia solani]